MGLTDLSKVTDSLIGLLERAVEASPLFAGGFSVKSLPPDKMSADALSLYLYHVVEDEAAKNMPPPDPTLPTKHAPMGLRLYYRLSVNHSSDTDGSSTKMQKFFGYALKIFHDYPELTAATQVDGATILDSSIGRMRIAMMPVAADDAVDYWTAGNSPMRLSAYYEVSTVFLEPEEPPSRAVRTRDRRVHASAGLAVSLTDSFSEHELDDPTTPIEEKIPLEASPAQPAVGATFGLRGDGWSGRPLEVRLYHTRYNGPLVLAPESVIFDSGTQLDVSLPKWVDSQRLLPGVYTASVRVTAPTAVESNRVPLTITADLSESDTVALDSAFTVGPGPFTDETGDPLAIEVLVVDQYLQDQTGGSLSAGGFRLKPTGELEIHLPDDVPTPVPVRVIVEGAESLPLWGGSAS